MKEMPNSVNNDVYYSIQKLLPQYKNKSNKNVSHISANGEPKYDLCQTTLHG